MFKPNMQVTKVPTTAFEQVSAMNEAFGNPKGDPVKLTQEYLDTPDNGTYASRLGHQLEAWAKVRNQCKNILDEFGETMIALGAAPEVIRAMVKAFKSSLTFPNAPVLKDVRDGLTDIKVFAEGAHHFMGIDADRDTQSVISGVMTRFIKDEADKEATLAYHAARGVTDVYFEGDYPTMIMKSAKDQPDAPKGKFLKSASYTEPVFYDPLNPDWCAGCSPSDCSGCGNQTAIELAAAAAAEVAKDL